MPVQILMPALSPAMGDGTLTRWLVGEGDAVTPGMVIAEIETARATMEIEAAVGGIVARILVAAGTGRVNGGAPIAELTLAGETPDARGMQPADARAAPLETETADPIRLAVSPLARRLAREKGVDLAAVRGSGPGGRIVKRDVEAAASAPTARDTGTLAIVPARGASDRRFDMVPADPSRRAIVARLTRAATDVPHAYLAVDCRLDEMLRTRARFNDMPRTRGPGWYRLTINDFVVKAWALALQRVPAANVSCRDGTPIRHQDSDLSVAMARDGGVDLPAIRHANVKSLSEISNEIRNLRAEHRGQRGDDDGDGCTTTISNLGMYGIKSFESVVHAPQSTLLAVGAAERRPVVSGERIEIATVMSCTLACDQRAIDGAVGAELLAAFKSFIEDPVRMLV